jgi:hypothetical protein
MSLEHEILAIVIHGEGSTEIRQKFGLSFRNISHRGKRGTTLQFASEIAELSGGADGINLHPAIREIPGVSSDSRLLSRVHGEIAIAHALYPARNEKSLRVLFRPHGVCHYSRTRSEILPEQPRGISPGPRKTY